MRVEDVRGHKDILEEHKEHVYQNGYKKTCRR